ncbi:hypothetical protein ASG25_15580 [Rhizobium sp. Leaf384]|uniref:hypothetical protein n=1 Tax=unclassified Rhizobium TaxID=2613769 RepID=UPI000715E837|nr:MULTISPECIES: hypothetical protein [unclassified Rhizobium]KQS76839.1 hypothetical protein ASG25_15580 [Rhizobium sp. Leaf384]KQS78110.1 hypothetical protein ASG58_06795 [Rhizobium sp. Leaf383]
MKSFAQEVALEMAGKAIFDVMEYDGPIGTERPEWVTCATTPRQDKARRRYASAALTAVATLPQGDRHTDDEPEACHVCCEALQPGDPVYFSDDGMMHAACCGPERECFYNEDEAPLVDGEPIPRPLIWNGDLSTMQLASDARNDEVCVDRFANVMKAKLAQARNKGRAGWDDHARCSLSDLSAMLFEHVAKGDPVDVANFAMMIHQRGGMIEAPSPQAEVRGSEDLRKRVMRAIFDPGQTEGYKGNRDLTTWQTDAVMRLLGSAAEGGR